MRSGQGNKTSSEGVRSYTGERKDDKMHGYGVLTWANDKRYEGNFKNGLREGKGSFT